MFKIVVALFLCSSASCLSSAAPGDFKTEEPSSLKLLHPGTTEAVAFKFSGSVRLSGQFLFAWREGKAGSQELQAVFYPDEESAARLPRMNIDLPVKELRFSNPQRTVLILLNPPSARVLLAKQRSSATGTATVTISHYTVSVACDRRWYEGKLVTASTIQNIVSGERNQISYGCG